MSQIARNGKRDGENIECKCGRKIGTLIPHKKFKYLYSLDLGNGNIAETFHGHCGRCNSAVHFDFHWEIAARLFNTDMEVVAGWEEKLTKKIT